MANLHNNDDLIAVINDPTSSPNQVALAKARLDDRSGNGPIGGIMIPILVAIAFAIGWHFSSIAPWLLRPLIISLTAMTMVRVATRQKGCLYVIAIFCGVSYLLYFLQFHHLIHLTSNGQEVPIFPMPPK